ncbi:hypothetical protein [Moraxella nonliquefaciens]|jgi:hypothetical protein|uniref:Uncharacterized protein n=1 Tax=Moraxella nonliquefaciens TaxID=478 RepID=A0A1B8PKH1_MORNO|nr:hypothetical protein [Moraxella nonliquefaciens]OBX51076.1 hypothetical protein A9Z60_08295 [Moraxella nonliquefaciens]
MNTTDTPKDDTLKDKIKICHTCQRRGNMIIQRRVRIGEFCTLLGKTRSTFDRWQKSGKIPKEDGHDPYPYWLENNVKTFVEHK